MRAEIKDILGQVKRRHPRCAVRLAFVGYADYQDTKPPGLDFTEESQLFIDFLDALETKGGRDAAEDVFSGLAAAEGISWASPHRILIHLADNPCHGREFHDLVGDNADDFLDGDLHGRDAAALLEHLVHGCKLTTYTFIHLTKNTHKMLHRFRELLGAALSRTQLHRMKVSWMHLVQVLCHGLSCTDAGAASRLQW